MSPEVVSPKSDRVRAVRALGQASVRSRRDQFLVEGPQSVREAVRFAAERVRDVYLTRDADERHPEIARESRDAGLYVHLAAPEVLSAMSEDAQGVLAVLQRDRVTAAEIFAGAPQLIALLHQVRDPGNAGTVIRAADAAGADACVLTHGSVDVHNPKVVRSTVGSLFHLPTATGADLTETITAARTAGMQVLAADGAGDLDLDDLADRAGSACDGEHTAEMLTLRRPSVWLFGNEAHGLGEAERELADAVVRIPIHGHAESLNLAMAATICLYASARAQRRVRR